MHLCWSVCVCVCVSVCVSVCRCVCVWYIYTAGLFQQEESVSLWFSLVSLCLSQSLSLPVSLSVLSVSYLIKGGYWFLYILFVTFQSAVLFPQEPKYFTLIISVYWGWLSDIKSHIKREWTLTSTIVAAIDQTPSSKETCSESSYRLLRSRKGLGSMIQVDRTGGG